MSSHNLIEFNKARNFSAKMNATYGFIRQNFKSFSKSLLIIAGPPVLIAGIFFIDIFQRLINSTTGAEAPGPFGALNELQSTNFALQILGIMLFMLVGGVFTVSTTYAYMVLYHEKRNSSIEVGEVWQRVRKTFWMNFLAILLYTIFLIIALFVLLIPVGIMMYLFATVSPFLIVIAYLGYYLFAFFLMVNFSMIFIIQNYEMIGFFKSIDKLFFLNRNKWWSTFGIGGINMYIQYVFAILLFIPGYIIMIINLTHDVSSTPLSKPSFLIELVSSISFVLYFLGSILLYALPLIGLAFQYFNLVESKQSKGLLTRIETIGQTVATSADEHGEF